MIDGEFMDNIYIKDIKMERYNELLDLIDQYRKELTKVKDENLRFYYIKKINYYNKKIENLKLKIDMMNNKTM